MKKNPPVKSADIIDFPGVGSYMYNANRLYTYEDQLRGHGQYDEADLVAIAASLYDHNSIDIEWDPASGEPILVSLFRSEAESNEQEE